MFTTIVTFIFILNIITYAYALELNIFSRNSQIKLSANYIKSNTGQYSKDKTAEVNPHWNQNQCITCHKNNTNYENISLSEMNQKCVDCHDTQEDHLYIHPTNITMKNNLSSPIMQNSNIELLLDKNEKVTCLTCHDALDQCLKDRSYQQQRNPTFLRGGPYKQRFTFCYKCHDSGKYERVNSHDQITRDGKLKIDRCRLCHEIADNVTIEKGVKRDIKMYPLLNGLNDDRSLLCVRCHRKIDHPSKSFTVKSNKKYRHLVKLTIEKKRTLDKQTINTGISLPIEPNTDRVYCGTCHQVHQPGVFEGTEYSETTEKFRLRSTSICKYCHDIYGSMSGID